ncbi:MAG: ECF transporter S component, partial [Clostridia bacterium]|nr:ECF transporter S component [Clostridia bacterium]
MKNKTLQKLVLSGLFLAIGYVLPFLTGQIQQIGNMLLPMHIPVLLCGLICGWKYGLAVGAILPVTRSLIFSMPVLYPNAVAMAFELAAYGFFIGFFYKRLSQKGIVGIYLSLIPAML